MATVAEPHQIKQLADVRQLAGRVPSEPWFTALGEPLIDSEKEEAVAYAQAVGSGMIEVVGVTGWSDATALINDPNWDQRWWLEEERQRNELKAQLGRDLPDASLLTALTEVTTAVSHFVHGFAAVAAGRTGGTNQGMTRAAAGAATQACYFRARHRRWQVTHAPLQSEVWALRRRTLALGRSRWQVSPILIDRDERVFMDYVFPAPDIASVAIAGSNARFPIHRIYCVGRNYAAHAREMGSDEREPPFFFAKPADAIVPDGAAIPYPPATKNLHHEIEVVVAIDKGGEDIEVGQALDHVFGYAVGVDLTRRDLQLAAREKGRPWDMGKGFDNAAPCASIRPVGDVGHIGSGAIWIKVNGVTKQDSDVGKLIWSVAETISHLSRLVCLAAGDLIYTGTPEGVGPIAAGDEVRGHVDRLGDLHFSLV